MAPGLRLTIKPTLAIGSYAPALSLAVGPRRLRLRGSCARPRNRPRHHRPAATAPRNWSAPPGVLPADGKRRVMLYMHGGAFLTCGVNTHGRLVNALSKFADARCSSSTTG